MNTNNEIMEIITSRRQELGLSLSEVARRLNIPKSTLSRYESLQRQFPLELIDSISNVLNIDPRVILGLNTSKKINNNSTYNEITLEILNILNSVDEENQKNILNFAKFEYSQAEEAKQRKEKSASVS